MTKKSTLIKPKRWQDRLRLWVKGYIDRRPEGVDHLQRCPKCGAKAYGKGKSLVSESFARNVYDHCMECGHNSRFGPQGPPPGTPVVEPMRMWDDDEGYNGIGGMG